MDNNGTVKCCFVFMPFVVIHQKQVDEYNIGYGESGSFRLIVPQT